MTAAKPIRKMYMSGSDSIALATGERNHAEVCLEISSYGILRDRHPVYVLAPTELRELVTAAHRAGCAFATYDDRNITTLDCADYLKSIGLADDENK